MPGSVIPVVACSHCHMRYVLRVAVLLTGPDADTEWLYEPDCNCRRQRATHDAGPITTDQTAKFALDYEALAP